MIDRKELTIILIITLILSVTISLVKSPESFLYALIAIFIVIMANIFTKKITSYILDSEIKIKLWNIKRYGFKTKNYLKNSFPAGVFLPILVTAFSFGYFYWMACFIFEVKAKTYRAAKRWGLYTFSEMTEYHVGLIAASGIAINLGLAVLGYLIGFSDFAKFNIYYAFFNLLPLSDLDGNKIFFGSIVLWSFLAILTLIGLGYAFLLV